MRPMRLVDIIQHDDAGPSDPVRDDEAEADTIELLPAYTNTMMIDGKHELEFRNG
jgi:hypothetical protein